MSIKRHIPNILTCISLAFGFYAAILGITGQYFAAMIAIFVAAIFDFSDGLAARLLKAYSPMGKELDSLADLISFGVAPGMMLYRYIDDLLHILEWTAWPSKLLYLAAFATPLLSALRLAQFNIDTRQTTSFLGLPVPAHAIFWSSLVATLNFAPFQGLIPLTFIETLPADYLLIYFCIAAFSIPLLLIAYELPMFSLKSTTYTWRANKPQCLLLLSTPLLLLLFGTFGITATIFLYILLSFILYYKQDDSEY